MEQKKKQQRNIERRYGKHADDQLGRLELRARGDGEPQMIAGYAAVYESCSVELWSWDGGFYEIIERGAFSNVLASPELDCRALWNHNSDFPIARTKNSLGGAPTLRLFEDEKGLRYEIDPPDTTDVRDLIKRIERGIVDGSSFGFMVDSAEWNGTHKGLPVRRIRSIALLDDVSPVTYPAYPATEAEARSIYGALPKIPTMNEEKLSDYRKRTAEREHKLRMLTLGM